MPAEAKAQEGLYYDLELERGGRPCRLKTIQGLGEESLQTGNIRNRNVSVYIPTVMKRWNCSDVFMKVRS